MRKIFPWFGWSLFGLLVLLQFWHPFGMEAQEGRGPHLDKYVPAAVPGWEVRDKEIGATESMADRATAILDFDDYVYRRYERAGSDEFFEIYAAYWAPGKASVMEVSSHTPDRCWTENGWTATGREHGVRRRVGSLALLPSEWRSFEIEGNAQNVHYWHLVGGRSYEYGERLNAFPTPVSYVRDLLRSHLLGTGEQYFIRVNTNTEFANLWEDPGFRAAMEQTAALGLVAATEGDRRAQEPTPGNGERG